MEGVEDAIDINSQNSESDFKIHEIEVDEIIFSLLDILDQSTQNEQVRNEAIQVILGCAKLETSFIIKSIISFLEVSKIDSIHQYTLLKILCKILSLDYISCSSPFPENLHNLIIKCHSFMLNELCCINNSDSRHIEIRNLLMQIGLLCPSQCIDYYILILRRYIKGKIFFSLNLEASLSKNTNIVLVILSLIEDICKHYPSLTTNRLLLFFVPLLKCSYHDSATPIVKNGICILYNLFLFKDIKPFDITPIDFNDFLYDLPEFYLYKIPNTFTIKKEKNVNKKNNGNYTERNINKNKSSDSPYTTNVSYTQLEPLLSTLVNDILPYIFTSDIPNCDDSICKALYIAAILSTHASETVWNQCIKQLCCAIVVRKQMYDLQYDEIKDSFPPVNQLECLTEWKKKTELHVSKDKKLFPQLISSIVSQNSVTVSDTLNSALVTICLRPYPLLGPHILSCYINLPDETLKKFYLFASRGIIGTLSFMESEVIKIGLDIEKLTKLIQILIFLLNSWAGTKNKYFYYGINKLVKLIDSQIGKMIPKIFNTEGNSPPFDINTFERLLLLIMIYNVSHPPVSIASCLIVCSPNLDILIPSNVNLFKEAALAVGFDKILDKNFVILSKCLNKIRLNKISYIFLLTHLFTHFSFDHPTTDLDRQIVISSINIILKSFKASNDNLPIPVEELFSSDIEGLLDASFKRLQLTEYFLKKAGLNNCTELLFPIDWFNNKKMRIPLIYTTILSSDHIANSIITNLLLLDQSEESYFSSFKYLFDDCVNLNEEQLLPISIILAYKSSFGSNCDKYFQMLIDTGSKKKYTFSLFTTAHTCKKNDFIRRIAIIGLALQRNESYVEEEGFFTITKNDRVWRYFLDELPLEKSTNVKRCYMYSINQFLNKNKVKFPNFSILEFIFEFPNEGINLLSNLILINTSIPNLSFIIAKSISLSPDHAAIPIILKHLQNDETIAKIIYETIINDYQVESLSKYPLITEDCLYKIIEGKVFPLERISKFHILIMTKLATSSNNFSESFLKQLVDVAANLTLNQCAESLNYMVDGFSKKIFDNEESVKKVLSTFLLSPSILHYVYTLDKISIDFKVLLISLVTKKLLVNLIVIENNRDTKNTEDSTIVRILLTECVCVDGVHLLVKYIDKLSSKWELIFDNYAAKYPGRTAFELAKAKKTRILYCLMKKIYLKKMCTNTSWIMWYKNDTIDCYLAKALILALPKVSMHRLHPLFKIIMRMVLRTLQSGICFAKLLELVYKLLYNKLSYKYFIKILILLSELLSKNIEDLSKKMANKLYKFLLIRIILLSKFSVDDFFKSTHFLRIFVKLGTNGGDWKSVIHILYNNTMFMDTDELKLALITFTQLFFSPDCWNFTVVDEEERKAEMQAIISHQKINRVTKVLYYSNDETERPKISERSDTIHYLANYLNSPSQTLLKIGKSATQIAGTLRMKLTKNLYGFAPRKIYNNTLKRIISNTLYNQIIQLEAVPDLEIPENKCSSDKLYIFNLLTFFTTLDNYKSLQHAYDLGKPRIPVLSFCASLLKGIEDTNSLVTSSLNIAISKQICQATKSDNPELQIEGIKAIGSLLTH